MSYVELEEVKFNDFAKVDYVANSAKTIISDGTETKAAAYDSLGYESSGINVTISCDNATSISISDGTTARTKNGSSASFKVQYGTYTVSATNGIKTVSEQLVVDTAMDYTVTLSFVHIYGIRRDQNSSSPEWTRTDEAVGKTVVASVGNVTVGHSDFDDCYPWSEMKRYITASNDVLVYIPEFWYKRTVQENGLETIQIADMSETGFEKHPGSGRYIAAYATHNNNNVYISQSGQSYLGNNRIPYIRSYLSNYKGTGWYCLDISLHQAIQMLYLVEFANNNCQTMIGKGWMDNTAWPTTGRCDDMQYMTGRENGTDGKTQVVYRGIEALWGNNFLIDGLNVYNYNKFYICTDPTKFACDTTTNHTLLSYDGIGPMSGLAVITKMGYDPDNSWCMLPIARGGSSMTTYYCDFVGGENANSNTWTVPVCGHNYTGAFDGGIFGFWSGDSNAIYAATGCRIMYVPSLDTNNSTTITGEWTYGG